ncbi:MAG: tetratricopeptide repeat protein [Myxococcota bacterium]
MRAWIILAAVLTTASAGAQSERTSERATSESATGESPASSAPARIAEARAACEEGAEAFAAGRFGQALDRFTRAYELAPRSELLFNIATAHDRLGHTEDALRGYRDYLDASPDAANGAYTQSRVEVLEAQIEDPTRDAAEGSAAEGDVAEGSAAEGGAAEGGVAGEGRSGGRSAAFALFAVGGAAAVTAALTGGFALRQRGDLDDRCTDGLCDPSARSDIQRLDRLTRSTDVMIGLAAAAVGAGLVAWILGTRHADVALGPTRASVRVSF